MQAIEHFAQHHRPQRHADARAHRRHARIAAPIPGTIRLVEDLARGRRAPLPALQHAGEHLRLPGARQHRFFSHFKYLVISGAILLIKPDPAIYKHLVEKTGIVPGRERVHR